MIILLPIVLAFLLGSIPSGYVLTKAFTGRDIRREGSGNVGASNVGSTAGLALGIAVGLLDILKGTVSVLLAQWAGSGGVALALVALAAVLGHNFSIFLRLRGGKGVATSFGVMLALVPFVTIAAMLLWLVIALAVRYASVASLAALALLPVLLASSHADRAYVILGVGLFVLAAGKHRDNLLRLAAGTERKMKRPW